MKDYMKLFMVKSVELSLLSTDDFADSQVHWLVASSQTFGLRSRWRFGCSWPPFSKLLDCREDVFYTAGHTLLDPFFLFRLLMSRLC